MTRAPWPIRENPTVVTNSRFAPVPPLDSDGLDADPKVEGLNSKIQWIKYTADGFRSREGFRRAIYFHCGELDMAPTH